MKKGIYFAGKIYHRYLINNDDWKKGTIESYDVINRHEWWVDSCQEVTFEITNGKAYIKKLGELKPFEYARQYCYE